jgi:hypothetical protein
MNKAIVVVPKYHRLGEGFTKAEKLKALEHPGRRTRIAGYQSPATWITELSDMRKGILLCSFCKVNFNPRRNKYRRRFVPDPSGKTDGYQSNGQCDACKERTEAIGGGGTFFVAEEYWELVSIDPSEAKRRARQRWRMAQELSLLNRLLRDNSNRRKTK